MKSVFSFSVAARSRCAFLLVAIVFLANSGLAVYWTLVQYGESYEGRSGSPTCFNDYELCTASFQPSKEHREALLFDGLIIDSLS